MKRLLFFLLFIAAPVFSQESAPAANENYPEHFAEELRKAEHIGDSRFAKEFTNMLLYLAGIVAFIFVLLWVMKRLVTTRQEQSNRISSIKILETRPLTPKSTLYVIEIYGKTFALADSINGVTCLSEISTSETPKPNE